jgi:hypothetical protein
MNALYQVLIIQIHSAIAALEESPSDDLDALLKEEATNADTEEEKEIWDAIIRYVKYLH